MAYFTKFIYFLSLFTLCSCSDPEILIRFQDNQNTNDQSSKCHDNNQCKTNEACVDGKCISAESFPCSNGQKPLLKLSSSNINFGEVRLNTRKENELKLTNMGTCTLIISSLLLENSNESEFSCALCEITANSLIIAPTQSLKVPLVINPKKPGLINGKVLVKSNDYSYANNGVYKVFLTNKFEGNAQIVLEPSEQNWGYAPFTAENAAPIYKTIRIANYGKNLGSAFIEKIFIEGDSAFFIADDFKNNFEPTWMQPSTLEHSSSFIEVKIGFKPSDFKVHKAKLVVNGHDYWKHNPLSLNATLKSSATGAPKIKISSEELLFRTSSNEPLVYGAIENEEIKISNVGQSELYISQLDTNLNLGFYFFPTIFPALAPGESTSLTVFFAPTFNSALKRSKNSFEVIQDELYINSNDPQNNIKKIALTGWLQNTVNETLTIEMNFDNSATGIMGGDFRNVDLELISPTGLSCTKPKPVYSTAGELAHFREYCNEWNAALLEGKVHWIAPGPFEKPERISLYNLDKQNSTEQYFTARIHYAEDCSFLPNSILSKVLGIGINLLTSIIAGQAGSTVATSPSAISEAISKNCFSRSPTVATVKFSTNGKELAAPQIYLFQKGDFADVMKIHYINNHFEVLQ